ASSMTRSPGAKMNSGVDLNLDLAAPGVPRTIPLTPEERAALGPLANLHVSRPLGGSDAEQLMRQIVQFVEDAKTTEDDPFASARALVRAELAFRILVRNGYSRFESDLQGISAALDRIATAARREIV